LVAWKIIDVASYWSICGRESGLAMMENLWMCAGVSMTEVLIPSLQRVVFFKWSTPLKLLRFTAKSWNRYWLQNIGGIAVVFFYFFFCLSRFVCNQYCKLLTSAKNSSKTLRPNPNRPHACILVSSKVLCLLVVFV
jgi:hypothetical protein